MNISSVSLNNSYYNNSNIGFKGRSQGRYRDTSYQDEFGPSQILKSKKPKKEQGKNTAVKVVAVPLTAATILSSIFLLPSPTTGEVTTVPFNGDTAAIHALAEEHGCDLDFLLDYNDIYNEAALSGITEIEIPSQYDYLQDEIDKTEEKLEGAKEGSSKQERLEALLEALIAKQEEQDQIADVYSDGEFIYFDIQISEEASEKYEYGINVETFKTLFDIEDGAIRRYNDLDVRWESIADGEGSYKDYTYNWFHTGDIIKVPVDAIQTRDIDVNDFMGE